MNSPRSLEACRQLGILPESLYYIDFKTYTQIHPDIIRLSKDIQKKRFENINKYREDTIELVKELREKIIEDEEKEKEEKPPTSDEEKERKSKKKQQILNLEKMLSSLREREEKDIEKIKQKQKNEIFHQIEKKIKNKIIINKSDMRDRKVKFLHNEIKKRMQQKAELEDQKQRQTEINRAKLFKEKIEKFESYNIKKHEGEQRQLERNEKDIKKHQKENEQRQKLKSEEYEERLKQSRQRVKEKRQKIIESIEKKQKYTMEVFNKLMEKREEKIKQQKRRNDEKFQKMQVKLKEAKVIRDKINEKSVIRQEKYQSEAEIQKDIRQKTIKNRAQSQSVLFEENQKRKDKMHDDLLEKYSQLEKEMNEKQEKREKEKKVRQYNLCIKQEDDYLKQYDKEQKIGRLERINIYKTEKRNEEILKKEKKMEDFKKKKKALFQSKAKLTDKMEKEKEKLINDFEKSFKKKEQVDANQLIEELFPEGKPLTEKDTELKLKIEKLVEEMNKTGNIKVEGKENIENTSKQVK